MSAVMSRVILKEWRTFSYTRDAVTLILMFFFFQAEDGIRDHCVTGVQTCALPISGVAEGRRRPADRAHLLPGPSGGGEDRGPGAAAARTGRGAVRLRAGPGG